MQDDASRVDSPVIQARFQLKSERELALMRRAGLLVWQAHQLAARLVRPGVTTAELDAAIDGYFARTGAIPLFKGVPGPYPFPAATCISVNEEVVHGIPGERVLRAGDIVSIDTGCKFQGWCGDSAYTHAVGEVRPQAQKLLDATRGVLELAIERMATAKKWSEVAAAMESYISERGLGMVEQMVGHGIGREMHEDPQVPHYVSPEWLKNSDFPLKPGLVLAVEPMVNAGGWAVRRLGDQWTFATSDGSLSAHFEHSIAVVRGGVRVLTAPPANDEERAFLAQFE